MAYFEVFYAEYYTEESWTYIIAKDRPTAEKIIFYATKDGYDYDGPPIKLGQLKKIIFSKWKIKKCPGILYKGLTQGMKPNLSDKFFSFKFP